MCKTNNFQIFTLCCRSGSFEFFHKKKGLGLVGVKCILAIYAIRVFEISSKHFYTSVVQDPKVVYAKKQFPKFLLFAIEMAILSVF